MPDTKTPRSGLLEDFLNGFVDLTKNAISAAIDTADDEDQRAVIRAFGPALTTQVSEVRKFILEADVKSTEQQKADVEQFLRISSGAQLAKSGKGLLGNIGSLIGKLGITRIIQEIKKILRELLKLFGIGLPKWLDAILLLINEIFSAIFGSNSAKTASMLSRIEVNYLQELTQFQLLQNASAPMWDGDDDDDF